MSILNTKSTVVGCSLGKIVRLFATFDLSSDYNSLQKTCKDFANNELRPIASETDRLKRFPGEQIKKLADLGFMGINVSKKYGGSELDTLATSIVVEEISNGCASTGIILAIHNCLYADLVNRHGTEKQKEEFLRPFTTGDIGAFALSEYNAGSDVVNISTTARRDGDFFVLNGSKAWVTSAYQAKAAIIFATVDRQLGHKGISAFLIPLNNQLEVSLGPADDKMGIKGTSTSSIILQDCRVHKDNLIGNIGEGFQIAMAQLQLARIGVASQALGIGQVTLDLAVSYASTRHLFGKQMIDLQLVKSKIAKMAVDLESARLLTWKAARLRDANSDYRKLSSMAKYAASRCATSNAHQCVQILGGMGYVSNMAAERHYRDARITQIYGGVTDVQTLIIAERVAEEYDTK
ncbi:short-chain specific acyl-CoA dehydrogenase, mitochondrial-like isoform X1 [Bradysia coprophila]|uniref:short-chain specific acyl-CoA dehydrogenase, mitochondrial-like isoform X1 n=2 Tax=Bradysia coprophila TaxID=38358 RepID=UPI00187DCD81|nr:short-chain specific acyl-CoA dehydrogenase, mitochondrial-like isoform X1 [Bradysia coprophila]